MPKSDNGYLECLSLAYPEGFTYVKLNYNRQAHPATHLLHFVLALPILGPFDLQHNRAIYSEYSVTLPNLARCAIRFRPAAQVGMYIMQV